ncbi:MAG: T9SS type A sorting domain-containing protein, partial [Flavobacteriales bacterium]
HSAGSFTNNGTLTATIDMGVNDNAMCNNYGTLNITDTLGIDTTATMHNYGAMNVLVTLNAGLFYNHFDYNGQDFWSSGTCNNVGGTGMNIASLYTDGFFTNNVLLEVSGSLYNSNTFTNTNQIVIDMNLLNGDTISGSALFTNSAGGLVSVGNDLLNSEDINGNGGKFCVQNQTSNSGTISGGVDICDLTGGNIDLNVGTVGGSVTFCINSCSIGVPENEFAPVNIYPNPFEDFIRIETDETNPIQCWLHDAEGRLVATTVLNGQGILNVPQAQRGVYVLTIRFADGNQQHSLITR